MPATTLIEHDIHIVTVTAEVSRRLQTTKILDF